MRIGELINDKKILEMQKIRHQNIITRGEPAEDFDDRSAVLIVSEVGAVIIGSYEL